MPRLIDADALIEQYKAKAADEWNKKVAPMSWAVAWEEIIDDIEEAPTVGCWISVKERLPEEKVNPITQDFTEVICFCDFGGIPRRTDIRTYKFGKRCWAEGGHFWHDGQIMDGVITHWMPLPSAEGLNET